MSTLKKLLSSLLVLAITAAPVMAGSNDAKTANKDAANATSAETTPAAATPAAASPNISPTGGDANITALLGVLVMKGVLAPAEANSIRNATATAQFQALVELLSRKGVINAADLSATTTAAPQPSAAAAAPAASPAPVPAAVPKNPTIVLASSDTEASPHPAQAPQTAQAAPPPPPPGSGPGNRAVARIARRSAQKRRSECRL
jgi:hypothetical protein